VSGSDNNNCKLPTTACKSIGHAISLAASGDSISVAAATYTENLNIGISLNILGSGAKTTFINGGQHSMVVKTSSTNANVALSGVTITNGDAIGLGGGGGIHNIGTLTMNQSTVSGNVAGIGGGIFNSGTLIINNSTISGNKATRTCSAGFHGICGVAGGGIYDSGTLIINNSTISGNSAVETCSQLCVVEGAGIFSFQLKLNSTTVSGNSHSCSKSCLLAGGGINLVNGTFQNSIVADNSGSNCYSTNKIVSDGYNLSSDSTCHFNGPGDMNNINPNLGPLQNNGGPTQTQALLPGSPAIDAGNPSGCTDNKGKLLKTDQRGMPRPDKEDTGGCDIGAYERQGD